MEITRLEAADREKFNDFVASSPYGDVLQTWEWGDLKAETGWKPLRVAVVDSQGRYQATASILARSLPVRGRSIFYAPRGPILADPGRTDVFQCLLAGIGRLAREHGAVLLKVDPPVPADEGHADGWRRLLTGYGFRHVSRGRGFESTQPRFVMVLDLEPGLDQLLANCDPKTRYNIRLAARKGVTVRRATAPEDLRTFYRLLEITAARDGFGIRDFSYFEGIRRHLMTRGLAALFLAEYQGQALAGAINFQFGPRTWYVYGASANEHRGVMPNHALQWGLITQARETGSRLYDFRGVSGNLDPQDPLYGLYRFKKGFDARLVEYIGEYDRPYQTLFYHLWFFGEPLYRRLRSRLRPRRMK